MNLLVRTFVLILVWTFAQCSNEENKLFFHQKPSGEDKEALLVVTWIESQDDNFTECEVFRDKEKIKEILSSGEAPIHVVSEDQMQSLIRRCAEFSPRRSRREIDAEENDIETERPMRADAVSRTTTETPSTTSGYSGIPVIFPGTKWCGAGDRAKNYDDLGLHQDTDRCCRAHDLCNDTLAPGETRNNLTNKTPFTTLSCKCDHDFYNCLDRVNSVTSNTVGNMYFNILKRQCYREDYPDTKKCKKYKTFLKLRCKEYEKDKKGPKVNQWVPAKKYKKIPFPGPLTITLPF